MMSKWLGSVSDLAMELWAALKSIFKPGGPGLFTFLAQKASAVVEWLQKKLMGVMQNVGDLFQGLAGGFSSTSKQLSLLAEQSLHTHLYTTAVVTLADLNKTTEVQAEEEAQDLLGDIPATARGANRRPHRAQLRARAIQLGGRRVEVQDRKLVEVEPIEVVGLGQL